MKGQTLFFMGYGHEEFGYKQWDLASRNIVISKDVFLKDQFVDDDDASLRKLVPLLKF